MKINAITYEACCWFAHKYDDELKAKLAKDNIVVDDVVVYELNGEIVGAVATKNDGEPILIRGPKVGGRSEDEAHKLLFEAIDLYNETRPIVLNFTNEVAKA